MKIFPFTTTPICTWLFTAAFFFGSFWSQLLSKYDNHLPWMLLKQVDSARRMKPRRRFPGNYLRDSRTDFTRNRRTSIHFNLPHTFARPNVILYDSNIVISQHACWRNCITRLSVCAYDKYLVSRLIEKSIMKNKLSHHRHFKSLSHPYLIRVKATSSFIFLPLRKQCVI